MQAARKYKEEIPKAKLPPPKIKQEYNTFLNPLRLKKM